GAGSVGRIHNPDEPIPLTVFHSLDTGSDVSAIGTIESTMDGSARHASIRVASSRKDDVPMRPFVQAWEIILPDIMIFMQKPGDDAISGFSLRIARIHP